jgi:trans-aconitate methyltransferase
VTGRRSSDDRLYHAAADAPPEPGRELLDELAPDRWEVIRDGGRRLDEATAYARRRWPDLRPKMDDPEVQALLAWIREGGTPPWETGDAAV